MKKKLFTYLGLSIISLFVGFTQVNAEVSDTRYTLTTFYDNWSETYQVASDYSQQIDTLIDYWNTNMRSYSSDYIIIYYHVSGASINPDYTNFIGLWPLTSSNFYFGSSQPSGKQFDTIELDNNNGDPLNTKVIAYGLESNSYFYRLDWNTTPSPNVDFGTAPKYYPLILKASSPLVSVPNPVSGSTSYNVQIPAYSDADFTFPAYNVDLYDYYPTMDVLVNGTYDPSPTANYIEVNVNNYEYIVLSLKNYNTQPFTTDLYVQGQLCLTSVYNYGMTEKNNIITGYKQQQCSVTYDTSSRLGLHIIQSDIDNHAVYYINKPSNNMNNIIKIDTSVFDITYITPSNVNNPEVTINGRSYPIIPYSNLTDTAIISTNEGYVSGSTCAIGDINCASDVTGIDISDLWTSPLQLFKTVGTSITNVLGVITVFIAFLPPTLQAFLYTSFFLVVILGILKILL